MNALLVEDAKGMRKLLASMLRLMGFDEVVEATNGAEALECLRTSRVQLVVTDWVMPGMGGVELVQKLRSDPATAELPVLMVTSRSSRENVMEALKAGVDSYVTKPCTPPQLRAKVEAVMGRRTREAVRRVLAGQEQLAQGTEDPVVILGEEAASEDRLSQPDSQGVAGYLANALASLERVNARFPRVHIAYRLERTTGDVTRRMRLLRQRLRLLLLSAGMPGGGVTLARLISIHRSNDLAVYVICEALTDLPTGVRHGLARLGVTLVERQTVTQEAFEQLFTEHVVAPLRESAAAGLPSPEEIHSRLEADIRSMVSLPVLPQVYQQIVELDQDRDSDLQAWIDVIDLDPLCRAQILRRARSPLYGFRGRIDETAKAVILLGKNAVKETIVSGAVKRAFERVREDGLDLSEFWLHSAAVAVTARLLSLQADPEAWTAEETFAREQELAELALSSTALDCLKRYRLYSRLQGTGQQDAFIGGMMHDIGKVALAVSYPGLFPTLLERGREQAWKLPMRTIEAEATGGADHTVVGRILADSWQLGPELAAAVAHHHVPGERPFTRLVCLADLLGGAMRPYPKQAAFPPVALASLAAGSGVPEELRAALQPFVPEGLLESLGLDHADLADLVQCVEADVRRLTDSLHHTLQ